MELRVARRTTMTELAVRSDPRALPTCESDRETARSCAMKRQAMLNPT
jgi:hypothetical protein